MSLAGRTVTIKAEKLVAKSILAMNVFASILRRLDKNVKLILKIKDV